MKTRIKTGVLTLALLVGTLFSVNAQDNIIFGVRGGMNVSNISGKGHGGLTMPRVGYNVGVTVDYALAPQLYLLSGIDFTTKGYYLKSTTVTPEVKSEAMYLQLPVHVGYLVPVNNSTQVVFHVGPYVAYGIGGKTKEVGTNVSEKTFHKDGLKKFDFGVGAGVYIDYSGFTIGVGYDHGLLNLTGHKRPSLYNSVASARLGVKF